MRKNSTIKPLLLTAMMLLGMETAWAYDQATGNKTNDATTVVEAADIAAFNAIEDGKTVKLTLTNTRVNAFNDLSGTYYVEDASGATAIKGIRLTNGTALNGYIVGKKGTEDVDYVNTPSQGLEYSLTVEDATLSAFETTPTELVGTAMTITDASKQTNYGRLVTLSDVTIEAIGNGKNKQLTDANGNTIKARDLFGVLSANYEWPAKASKVTGVVLFYMTGWFIIPISEKAIEPAAAEPTTVTFDFTLEGEQSLRGYVGTAMNDPMGWFYNETFAVENVSLQITCGSAASRIYKDNNRGVNLAIYKEYTTLTFRAPDGYAISSITFTAAGNSNINNFTATSGTIDGMTWTGNAEGIRFTQGGTSNLANAIVTLAAKDDATVALPAIEYTECANIAAFNALAPGTYAKVHLNNAEVIGLSADGVSTAWIQDATGGCWMQYTTLIEPLAEGMLLNGYYYTVARYTSGNQQMKEAEDTPDSEVSVATIDNYTMVEGTLAEVNIAANLNKVVKISGATLEETSTTAGKLTQGDASIDVNNGTETANQQLHKIADWAKDTKLENITIVAILVAKSASANQLLPISIKGTATGIQAINDNTETDIQIYNLHGIRMDSLQKGLNIVNGKKVVIK